MWGLSLLRAGHPFLGPSVFLMLVVLRVVVWPFLLRVWWLALPSWGSGFRLSFLGEVLALPSRARPFLLRVLVVGISFLRLGFGFSLLEWVWPFLLGVWWLALPS